MFNKLAELFLGFATKGATAGATGGASLIVEIVVWVIRHLPEILLATTVVVVLSMYGCQKHRAETLEEEKAKLEESVKAKDAEIVSLKEEVAVQKDLAEKRLAELAITKTALEKQGAIEAATEEAKKKKDEILDKWANEKDPAEKAKIEAEYWNSILGIKTSIDKKTNAIKLLGPMKPIRSAPIGGGVR